MPSIRLLLRDNLGSIASPRSSWSASSGTVIVSRDSNDSRYNRPTYVPVGVVIGLILAFVVIISICVFSGVMGSRRKKNNNAASNSISATNANYDNIAMGSGSQLGKRPASAVPDEDLPPYPGPAHFPPSYRYSNDDGAAASGSGAAVLSGALASGSTTPSVSHTHPNTASLSRPPSGDHSPSPPPTAEGAAGGSSNPST